MQSLNSARTDTCTMKKEINQILILNIKRELKQRGSNIGKLCKSMGVNRNYINQIGDNVGASKLISIAHAIGCTPAELFDGL